MYAKNTPLTAAITPPKPLGIKLFTPLSSGGIQLCVAPVEKTK